MSEISKLLDDMCGCDCTCTCCSNRRKLIKAIRKYRELSESIKINRCDYYDHLKLVDRCERDVTAILKGWNL